MNYESKVNEILEKNGLDFTIEKHPLTGKNETGQFQNRFLHEHM